MFDRPQLAGTRVGSYSSVSYPAGRQDCGWRVFGGHILSGIKEYFCPGQSVGIDLYEAELRDPIREKQGLEPCAIDLAHTIIYGAIDYARQFGFYPQRDFELSRYVLEERDSVVLREDVEFGKDDKPLYISGPDDNVRKITRQLENVVGQGNFDFMISGP